MTVFKATRKPVTIEVLLWDGANLSQVENFTGSKLENIDRGNFISHKSNDFVSFNCITQKLFIRTLEGEMKVSTGDYIIKDVQGEFYPCKPDIFELTYDFYKEE